MTAEEPKCTTRYIVSKELLSFYGASVYSRDLSMIFCSIRCAFSLSRLDFSMEEFPPMQTDGINEALLSSNASLVQPLQFTGIFQERLDDDFSRKPASIKLHAAPQENAAHVKAETSLRQKLYASETRNAALCKENAAVVQENAALCQRNAAHVKAETSLRQKLYASETRNALLGQKPSAFQSEHCNENKSLGQELAGSQKDLNVRQLLTEHRRKGMGKELDIDLLKKARNKYPKDFNYEPEDCFKKPVNTYSGFVNHLVTEKMNLLKEKNDDNPSSDRLSTINSEIKSIETKLDRLKAVAISFEKPEMKWNGNTVGEGHYTLCLFGADANRTCHPDMTKKSLSDMSKRANRREYTYDGVNLGPIIQVLTRDMLLRIASSSTPRKGSR